MSPPPSLPPSLRVFERGWLSSNNVLLHDDDGATLVDTGYVTHNAQTLALVERGLGGRRLSRIVNTHLHSDHCGGNALLKRAFGATLLIPPGHADAVARWDEDELTFRATGQQCERFRHDAVIVPGSTLTMGGFEWQVIAAPGHDPNSVILWAAEPGILISADALWESGFGAIFPEIEGESGFAEQRALLQVIERLAPRVVLPGHGAPFSDVRSALRTAYARLESLEASAERNARHAARALIKFYLLEVRRAAFVDLVAHFGSARYFRVINERYFRLPFDIFLRQQVDQLVAAGAAAIENDTVLNRDR